MNTRQQIPRLYNLDAEQGLLAAIILDGAQGEVFADTVSAGIEEDAFYKRSHQLIWRGIVEMARKNLPLDDISLGEQMSRLGILEEAGGRIEIDRIMARIEQKRHASHWRSIVEELYLLRRFDRLCDDFSVKLREPIEDVDVFFDQVESHVFQLTQKRIGDQAVDISDKVDEMVNQIFSWVDSKGMPAGVPTGFSDLDKLTFGLHPKEMTVLAARPSVGKTAFALNIAENAAMPRPGKQAKRVLIFSLEMGAEQLVMRMLCSNAQLRAGKLREGFLNDQEKKQLLEAAKNLQKAPILIDDSGGLSIMELMAKSRREHARQPLDLIIVDYLQLLKGSQLSRQQSRENEIREISASLKTLAKELSIPVIVLSQLNRESEKDGRKPRLSDLRESGAIEQDADVVLILAREVVKKNAPESEMPDMSALIQKRHLIIAKQRNGPCDELLLAFDGGRTRFYDWSDQTADAAVPSKPVPKNLF